MPVLDTENLNRKLAEIVSKLRAALSPLAIYFFGSYAYGTPQPHSDIDLLVVVEDGGEPISPYQRDAKAFTALCDLGVPKDVMVYTRNEFERRAALPVSFERTVKTRGKLIYGA